MTVLDRFLRYVKLDTQSSYDSPTCPSTDKQKVLGELLVEELKELGLRAPRMDGNGYVYALLPATPGCETVPCLGLIAHMDTSSAASGANVNPQIIHYEGGDIPLGHDVTMKAADFESLAKYVGQDLIVTDGATLLGADDKAGVAEIMTMAAYLTTHPEIPHGPIAVGFTPDEEIGRGADKFDVQGFGAAAAYTVDGGELGELNFENFNAAGAKITCHGLSIHTGSAKDKMKNAALIALEFASLLPPAQRPEHTENREGFYHLESMDGDVTTAHLRYILRDHDKAKFQAKKAAMLTIADFLNQKYGEGTVEVELKDQYFNMLEPLKAHMELVDRARAAFAACDVTCFEEPIRGGTDGARLTYMGLPCPNLSTGGANFHGLYEYIPVRSLEKMVEVLVELVRVKK